MYEWWPTRERPYPGVLFVFRYRLRTLALTSPVCGICKQSMGTFLWERLPDEQRSTHLEIEALAAAEGLNQRTCILSCPATCCARKTQPLLHAAETKLSHNDPSSCQSHASCSPIQLLRDHQQQGVCSLADPNCDAASLRLR